jgi:hypothetical protein
MKNNTPSRFLKQDDIERIVFIFENYPAAEFEAELRKAYEQKCDICEVERDLETGECDCRLVACSACGDEHPKYELNLVEGCFGLRCDECDPTRSTSCYECGECLDDPATHIFCFSKEGEEDRTLCCGCGQDLHKEYKSDGWTRDDDSEGDSDSDAETEIDDDEDQDNFTNRVCGWHECRKDFDLFDPHYYDEEMGECFCCEECFKKEQNRFAKDDDSEVSEDTCECCGRPYDHRNPHRQSEMCDCVQNDDGTLSRPKEETDDEEEEKVECEGCGGKFYDDDTLSTRYNDKYCEKCWEDVPKELHPYIEGLDDEEGDELNAAIDASGNALW